MKKGGATVSKKSGHFFLFLIFVIIIIFLVVWLFSLAKCRILTTLYSDFFEPFCQSNPMLGESEFIRVLRCNKSNATVYCISQGKTSGNILSFEKENGTWVELDWNTVWSDTGSASSVVWPYWWHFVYGGL